MQDLVSSPAMIVSLSIVLILEAISLLALFAIVQLFRSQSQRYQLLFANMGNQEAWGNPGRVIFILYVLFTLISMIGTTLMFLFQPHIL